MQSLRCAVVQLSSQDDIHANLARVTVLVREAAKDGARVIALPENFAFMGEEAKKLETAEILGKGPISKTLSSLAKETHAWIVAGGMPEASTDPQRPYNTSVLVDPEGWIAARYRKVHLFDVDLPDGTSLKESAATSAGDAPCVADVEGTRLGMTVCYDVRFPELYRKLTDLGARVVTVPAAFTLTTGKDHWHTLMRARAIENQVFVLAPAQWGKHPRGRQTYGKSLIVDPWGAVIAEIGEGEGYAVARLDFEYQDKVRASLPCLSHRRVY